MRSTWNRNNGDRFIGWGTGCFPTTDPWGREFTKTFHPQRMKLGGKKICGDFVAILEAVQADQDFIRILFKPDRPLDIFPIFISKDVPLWFLRAILIY